MRIEKYMRWPTRAAQVREKGESKLHAERRVEMEKERGIKQTFIAVEDKRDQNIKYFHESAFELDDIRKI